MTKAINPVLKPAADATEFAANLFNAATITLAAALGLLTVVATF
jgi:hypothetical protein